MVPMPGLSQDSGGDVQLLLSAVPLSPEPALALPQPLAHVLSGTASLFPVMTKKLSDPPSMLKIRIIFHSWCIKFIHLPGERLVGPSKGVLKGFIDMESLASPP